MPRVRANCSQRPVGGPGAATQERRDAQATGRRDAIEGRKRARDRCDRVTNAGNAKPSYRKERDLGELETIMK
jgi:hypothetical protein